MSKTLAWPELPYGAGQKTYETIHMWTQIIGKVKLKCMPWVNHSWHVALQFTPSGLSTGLLSKGNKSFEISLDFLKHEAYVMDSDCQRVFFSLKGLSVAGFYNKIFESLKLFNIDVVINKFPNEVINPIAFQEDHVHNTYVPGVAEALHKAILRSFPVFSQFRAEFVGKCSPLHFFWGSFDVAFSRFSGRLAPDHPGGIPNLPDWVVQEAYSHEVFSSGFWPGSESFPHAAFYSYIYPEPSGFKDINLQTDSAFYHDGLKEFVLPYEEVRRASDPSGLILDFLHSSYNAAADLANWDRKALEKKMT
ncbi:DUF5996 family protein [Cytophagaceae bacterium ABcell3]|nr:DUF5996 family protein [Cytophagaceae bacterium ABcell3]